MTYSSLFVVCLIAVIYRERNTFHFITISIILILIIRFTFVIHAGAVLVITN